MNRNITLALLVSSLAAFGQVDRASITGTLRDPSGAVISGGSVRVTFPATGLRREVTSNGSGAFLVPGLPIGHAVLDASKDGFRPLRVETDLNVGETKTMDLEFTVAGVENSVQVVAEA